MKKRLKVKFAVLWFDFWVGFYYDQNKKVIYFAPIPMCVFSFRFEKIEEILCLWCDSTEAKKAAYNTGDGWWLHLICAKCEACVEEADLPWPFKKDTASSKDLIDIGYEII